jgi:hypothetical protein
MTKLLHLDVNVTNIYDIIHIISRFGSFISKMLPLFIEVHVQSQESEQSYICV